MKKRLTSLISTVMGCMAFLFGGVAFLIDKMGYFGMVGMVLLGAGLLAVTDAELNKAFNAVINIFSKNETQK